MVGDVQLWAFWIQGFIHTIVFPMSFFAYRWVRAPRRDQLVRYKLAELGLNDNDEALQAISNHHYRNRDYAWSVFAASFMVICSAAVFLERIRLELREDNELWPALPSQTPPV